MEFDFDDSTMMFVPDEDKIRALPLLERFALCRLCENNNNLYEQCDICFMEKPKGATDG